MFVRLSLISGIINRYLLIIIRRTVSGCMWYKPDAHLRPLSSTGSSALLHRGIRMNKRSDLKINDIIHGFTVTGIRDIEEFEGQLIEMTHIKTGAGLVWAACDEENKLFSVGFRTLPEDNTGVFHILEHSVLCGSEKFPVKEPFVELIKTSMNTFLNAMTYSDKTLYPVSSRMEQDYLNLMEVYLDAVFHPSILSNPNIFYQEGWHIDLAQDPPVYKGVVFNEMKGAMSDVDQVAERTLLKLLFPDTCYGFNSGGDPESIPDLTYEDFISTYRKFYHPSNACFYLDGDIPLDKTLMMIDSYLDNFDKSGDVPEIGMQDPVKCEASCRYEVNGDDGKAMIVFGRIAGTWEDRDKLLALSVLTEQLADSNESPLKRAVLSSGLAEDLELYISDGIAQPYLMIVFRGVDPSGSGVSGEYEEQIRLAGDRLLEIVREVAEKTISDGIPARDLEASVNQLDFRFRQYPEPQGLYRANAVLSSWLYGGDPALYLKSNEAIANLKQLISDGIMEALLREYLLDTGSLTRLTMLPDPALGGEKAAAEAARITGIIDSMTDDEKKALEELNSSLSVWQETPDSEEALITIPQLDIKDIKKEPELIGTEVSELNGVTVLYHPVTTNGIVYINAYFPITDLSFEDLPAAALVSEFYKDLPTENYNVKELQNEIRMYVGSMSFGIDINAVDGENRHCTPCLRGRAAVLKENLSHAEELLIEIMTRTRFDDVSLMKELITQIYEEGKRYAVSSGHRIAVYASRSHYSARDAAAEAINGYTFLQYMHEMNSGSDEKIKEFAIFAEGLVRRTVVKNGAFISVTSSEKTDVSRLIEMLPDGYKRPDTVSYSSPLPLKLGMQIPASVAHSVMAYDLSQTETPVHGSMSVAANILSFAYLWNEVRVKGGAYGASVNASRTGSYFCYSFRDPSPERSLEIYAGAADFLEAFAGSGDVDLSGFIISTIAQTEPLVSPASKGRSADDFWFSGFSDEDRIRIRKEILETTADDLLSWKEAFRNLASSGSVCVIGPKTSLDECGGLETVNV